MKPSKPHPVDGGRLYRFTFHGRKYASKTEAGAWAKLAALKADAERPAMARAGAPATINGLIDRWKAVNGAGWTVQMIDAFRRWAGTRPLADVDPDLLTEFATYARGLKQPRNDRPYSRETIHKWGQAAARILRWAASRRWIPAMPDVPRLPKGQPHPHPLSEDEIADLLGKIDANLKLQRRAGRLLRFMLLTGCRPKEGRLLQWEWIDWDRQCVVIPGTMSKTGRPRTVELSAEAISLLRGLEPLDKTFVFVSYRGRPYARAGLDSICDRLKIQSYWLRHTFIQRCFDSGIPDAVIAAMVGHSDVSTLKYYRRPKTSHVRSAVQLVPPLPQPALPDPPETSPADSPKAAAAKTPPASRSPKAIREPRARDSASRRASG